MDKAEIPFLSASQLSELIKNRSVSPVEAVEAYLDRIDALNGRLFAYLTVTREEALLDAHESARALDRGEYRGPMHGVPVAVKDQLNTSGIRTTSGTPIFEDFVPTEDATVIAKLKAAGAILLGKLNMTEFGTTSLSHAFNTARNPWTWRGLPAVPAAAREAPRLPSCAPRPWAKTPEGRYVAQLPGAAWSASDLPGAGSAATG